MTQRVKDGAWIQKQAVCSKNPTFKPMLSVIMTEFWKVRGQSDQGRPREPLQLLQEITVGNFFFNRKLQTYTNIVRVVS